MQLFVRVKKPRKNVVTLLFIAASFAVVSRPLGDFGPKTQINKENLRLKRNKGGEDAGGPSIDGFGAPSAVPTTDPFGARHIHPVLRTSLSKVSTVAWNLDPRSVLESEMAKSKAFQCNWVDFQSSNGTRAKFCGHDRGEVITNSIIRTKRWMDCDILPRLWNAPEKTSNSVYLEIGANIGSCVLEMLLSTDAKVIAFEPHPKNQFLLQNTIQTLDPMFQERFVLVPVALGNETSQMKLFSNNMNMGNSVVGKVIKDFDGQTEESFDSFDINVERLSSIIDSNSGIDISLIKMDAQGFECQILDGIDPILASKIRKVKFEVAPKWLDSQGCADLFGKFRDMGFEVQSETGFVLGQQPRVGVTEAIAVQTPKIT